MLIRFLFILVTYTSMLAIGEGSHTIEGHNSLCTVTFNKLGQSDNWWPDERVVEVMRGEHREGFERTNRGLKELLLIDRIFPKEIFDSVHLKGKKILDIGTGNGQLVKDLREMGFEAVGLDIAIRDKEK